MGDYCDSLFIGWTLISYSEGYGQSREKHTRTFPVDFYARDAKDAAALMESLGYDEYAVLGWSDGANTGVHLAAMYPGERLASPILADHPDSNPNPNPLPNSNPDPNLIINSKS